MFRLLPTFALAVVLVAAGGSAAQDGKKDKKAGLSGKWARESGGVELKFDFSGGKSPFKASVMKGDAGFSVTCKYEVTGGVVKAEITAVEEKGNFPNPPAVGYEFSFKWVAKGGTAELSELKADNVDTVRALVEGEYTRVKGKKD